ncbi:MAG: hypothetical protein ACPMAQ_16245 [Phycisphaerae bacterium]
MTLKRIGNRVMRSALAAALAGGSLLAAEPTGCDRAVQRELEVLVRPEANESEFYNSYLMNHSWGRELIKWFNQW